MTTNLDASSMPNLRKCWGCNLVKNTELDFAKDCRRKDHRQYLCRACFSRRYRERTKRAALQNEEDNKRILPGLF